MHHKWDDGELFVSVEGLAKEMGWSKRQAQRTIRDLMFQEDDRDSRKTKERLAAKGMASKKADDDENKERKPLYLGLLRRQPRHRPDGRRTSDLLDFEPLFAKLRNFATLKDGPVANESTDYSEVEDVVEDQPVVDPEEVRQIVISGSPFALEQLGRAWDWAYGQAVEHLGYNAQKHGSVADRYTRLQKFEAVKAEAESRKDGLHVNEYAKSAMWNLFVQQVEEAKVA